MVIKHISIKKKKGLAGSDKTEYHICDEKGRETILASDEIGEVVGHKGNLLLCKANGKYKVCSLQGELVDEFQMYVNPYPLKVVIRIGRYEPTFYERAEDEEDEAALRRKSKILSALNSESIESGIAELLKRLEEKGCSCQELTLYHDAGRDLSRYLQEYLFHRNRDLKLDGEKLCELALSLAQHLC